MSVLLRNIVAGAFCLGTVAAHAAVVDIPGLVNTGFNASPGQQDPNYKLTKNAGTAIITNGLGWEGTGLNSNWLTNDSTSQWLTPEQNGDKSLDPSSAGEYVWTLNFDLTNYVASTATFSGQYRTDNLGKVSLNGHDLGASILSNDGNFRSTDLWKTFSVAAGSPYFNAGMNSLVFTVTNLPRASGNPSGLRVEIQSSVAQVPEPEAYGLALAGMSVVALAMRRRRK